LGEQEVGKNYTSGSFRVYNVRRLLINLTNQRDGMGVISNTFGEMRNATKYGSQNLKGRDPW
jgi:hypothetical protein